MRIQFGKSAAHKEALILPNAHSTPSKSAEGMKNVEVFLANGICQNLPGARLMLDLNDLPEV